MEERPSKAGIWLVFIVLVAAALRLFRLGAKGLWYDEACSIAMARVPLDVKNFFQTLAYKPIYFVLMKMWTLVFVMGEFWVRFPSALFGALGIPAVYLLGKEISASKRTGLTAAFLLAISCFHIYHSQQARHFTFMMFLTVVSFLCLIRALRENNRGMRRWNMLVNILLIFLHPYALAVILTQAGFVCVYTGAGPKREWLRSGGITLVFILIWLLIANKPQMFHNVWWIPRPDVGTLIETFKTFAYGGSRYGLDDYRLVFDCPWVVHVLAAIYLIFFLTGTASFFHSFRKGRDPFKGLILLWLWVPIALALLVSFVRPVYVIKHLMICLPAYGLITAAGINSLRPRFAAAVCALIFALNLYPLGILYERDLNVPWKEGVRFLKSGIGKTDAVLVSTASELKPFLYYFGDRPGEALEGFDPYLYCRILGGRCPDMFYEKKNFIIGVPQNQGEGIESVKEDFEKRLKALRKSGAETVWLLASRWTGDAEQRNMLARLGEWYQLTRSQRTGGIDIFEFKSASRKSA